MTDQEIKAKVAEEYWLEWRDTCPSRYWDISWRDLDYKPYKDMCYRFAKRIYAIYEEDGYVKLAEDQSFPSGIRAVERRLTEVQADGTAWRKVILDKAGFKKV